MKVKYEYEHNIDFETYFKLKRLAAKFNMSHTQAINKALQRFAELLEDPEVQAEYEKKVQEGEIKPEPECESDSQVLKFI